MANINTFELKPTTQKSYYGKAKVTVIGDYISLTSYTTKVATVDQAKGTLTVNGWYSNTTSKHITDFIKMYCDHVCGYRWQEVVTMILKDNKNFKQGLLRGFTITKGSGIEYHN